MAGPSGRSWAELGLTYTQYIAIVALWEQDDPDRQPGLGEKLFLEFNTLTPILKKLDKAGLSPAGGATRADERQVLVSLTAAGRRLREKGLGMNLVAATGLSAEAFPAMQKAVVTLRDNLVKAAQVRG